MVSWGFSFQFHGLIHVNHSRGCGGKICLAGPGRQKRENRDTYVLTHQQLPLPTIIAPPARFRVIRRHAVADLEVCDLGTDSDDDTDGLVARGQREGGDELAFVDVLASVGQLSLFSPSLLDVG